MKKALLYDPYLDTLGGGERYMLTLAEYLLKQNWQVDFCWGGKDLLEILSKRFNLKLKGINFVKIPVGVIEKYCVTSKYDLVFWLSDGSLPYLFSKNNVVHFQVPFHEVNGQKIINQFKINRIKTIVCNSEFTKKFIDKEFGVESKVIYPPVDIKSFKPQKKEKIILSVGRFSQLLQAKRQDILIQTFQEMYEKELIGWKMILAGATDIGGKEYFKHLKEIAKGLPVEFKENPQFNELKELYEISTLFWSASGYGIEEEIEPEKVEHFGMAIVESMAAGCIPIVVKKGGAIEILGKFNYDLLWEQKDELRKITTDLIADEEKGKYIAQQMIKLSKDYSKEIFIKKFNEII